MTEERNSTEYAALLNLISMPICSLYRNRLVRYPTPPALIPRRTGLVSLAAESFPPCPRRRRRRYSPYLRRKRKIRPFVWTSRCHSKFTEAVKQSGGFDKVPASAVWEIMKTETMDGVITTTLSDASRVLDMLRFMFPDYMVNPPLGLNFLLDDESESDLCEAMLGDFGKLELEPKAESSSCDSVMKEFGKLNLEQKS